MPSTMPPIIAIARATNGWLAISEIATRAVRNHHAMAAIKRKRKDLPINDSNTMRPLGTLLGGL
jgi:hypothetical protein